MIHNADMEGNCCLIDTLDYPGRRVNPLESFSHVESGNSGVFFPSLMQDSVKYSSCSLLRRRPRETGVLISEEGVGKRLPHLPERSNVSFPRSRYLRSVSTHSPCR